jgi:hypothetical protein
MSYATNAQRPHYRPLVVKMAVERPEIRFDAISHSTKFDELVKSQKTGFSVIPSMLKSKSFLSMTFFMVLRFLR